jgi:membrane-associated phospholipid phosphatase
VRDVADRRALLLWSGFAVTAMFALGWAVGASTTSLDGWFQQFRRGPARELLIFTSPWLLCSLLVGAVAVTLLRRRWRMAAVMLVSPLVGIVLARWLKELFGREKDGALAYPSGHTTAAVVVVGMIVLAAGSALWAVLAAAAFTVLAMIGQGVTYHYFTDTVGALLLGSAVVCVAVVVAELDTRQPACDADHTSR